MRQYTTPGQTAKLIELGFEEPKAVRFNMGEDGRLIPDINYNIGQLLSFLPTHYDAETKRFELTIAYSVINSGWIVGGTRYPKDNTYAEELIDALYDMVVKLKDKGLI